jgi:hypothetical protein
MKLAILLASGMSLLLTAAVASAQNEDGCTSARYRAAGKYANCQAKAMAYPGSGTEYALLANKCAVHYANTWSRLARYTGTSCDGARFEDNGNGTVTDHLTGLVWEKKTNRDGSPNPSDPHDADNGTYSWANGDADETDEDGTVFSEFLAALNAGAGFAGATGWRLPTVYELQTILLPEKYQCMTHPCVDPLLLPDASSFYWTATSNAFSITSALGPVSVMLVNTDRGGIDNTGKLLGTAYVRAVRGGSH